MARGLSKLRRLTADARVLDAADLQEQCRPLATVAVSDLRRGMTATVAGRLRSVCYTPRQHVPTLTAELSDGTGTLVLTWLGRRRITGVEPGRWIVVTGRVGTAGDSPTIYNPRYELWQPSA